jgi:hypothetical protein
VGLIHQRRDGLIRPVAGLASNRLMLRKFPQILRYALTGKKGVFLVRIIPEVISVLDYRKEFGHTDLIKI